MLKKKGGISSRRRRKKKKKGKAPEIGLGTRVVVGDEGMEKICEFFMRFFRVFMDQVGLVEYDVGDQKLVRRISKIPSLFQA